MSKCPELYFGLIFRGTGISSSAWKSLHPLECEARDGWEARVCLLGCFKGLNACAFLYGRPKPLYIYIFIYKGGLFFFPPAPIFETFPTLHWGRAEEQPGQHYPVPSFRTRWQAAAKWQDNPVLLLLAPRWVQAAVPLLRGRNQALLGPGAFARFWLR